MNTRAQLRYLPGGIVRASAECADAGMHLFGLPGDVPPPHRCYLPPEHGGRWHRCRCGCRWTLEGWVHAPCAVPGAHGRVEPEPEPEVQPAPTVRADHPWLVWVGRGLALVVLVVVVIGATGPW